MWSIVYSRWLVAHGKREEAARVLHKVAKYNNVTLSRRAASMLHELAHRKVSYTYYAPVTLRLHGISKSPVAWL